MIRGATVADYEIVKNYVEPLVKESVFGFCFKDYVLTEEIFDWYTTHPLERMTLIFEEEGKPVGFVMFDSVLWPFPGKEVKFARIPFVYIEKEYRKTGNMDLALEAFEYWAKRIGALYCAVGVKNKKRGYKKAEVIYIKEVE